MAASARQALWALARFGKATKSGITFRASLPKIDEPAAEGPWWTWPGKAVKAKLVRGVSIGFRALGYEPLESGGLKFTETEIYELSLVTIPAKHLGHDPDDQGDGREAFGRRCAPDPRPRPAHPERGGRFYSTRIVVRRRKALDGQPGEIPGPIRRVPWNGLRKASRGTDAG